MDITSILVYLIIIIASGLVYIIRKNHSYWRKQGIPHEEPNVISGNLQGLRTSKQIALILADYTVQQNPTFFKITRFCERILCYYHKFKGSGPFAGFYMVHRPAVVLLDKTTIKNVLIKDFTNFADRGLYYNEKNDPLTGHLFFLDGQKWRNMRNKLSPTFTSGKMKQMFPTLLQVADEFVTVLADRVKENAVLEVRDVIARLTIDIIGSVAFGIECNTIKNPNDKFLKLGRKSVEVTRHNAIIMGFIDGYPKLARMLGMRIIPTDVHEFFMKTITDTVKYREQNKMHRNDFLNILIELKNNPEDKSGLGGMTIEEICAQVFVFFLAGFETSSSTMSYALYELAKNQEIQDRLREEVREVFKEQKISSQSYEAIMNMSYMNQVLCETLRKYPILAQLNREALNDYTIPGHPKYVIRKGTPVLIPVYGIHHDPEYYPNPELFDPERFSPEMVKQRDSVEWLPFGDGPRNCIGMRFAKMQSRLGLACILNSFRVGLSPKTTLNLEFDPKSILLQPKGLFHLKLESLEN